MNSIKKALLIWWRMAAANFAVIAVSRLDFYSFISGKMLRMFFFFFFILALFSHVPTIAGYTRGEILLFFALMNMFDLLSQLLWFRGLTDVQRLIRFGEFDFILTKPVSSLVYSSFRIFDVFDFATVPAMIFFITFAFNAIGPLPPEQIVAGIFMCILGLVLAYSVVLALSSLNFWTTEVHNAFWLYRDAFYMAQYPPEVFPKGIQVLFTYYIPLFIIVSFPVKAFLGTLGFGGMVLATVVVIVFLSMACYMWKMGLRHYTSASS